LKESITFDVDHVKLNPGIYFAKKQSMNETDTITIDIRMRKPYQDTPLTESEAHTLEHCLATAVRDYIGDNHDIRPIYIGPMGCMTGFYLVIQLNGKVFDSETGKNDEGSKCDESSKYGKDSKCGKSSQAGEDSKYGRLSKDGKVLHVVTDILTNSVIGINNMQEVPAKNKLMCGNYNTLGDMQMVRALAGEINALVKECQSKGAFDIYKLMK